MSHFFIFLLIGLTLIFWSVGAFQRIANLRQTILEAQQPLVLLLQQHHAWIKRIITTFEQPPAEDTDLLARTLAACHQADTALDLLIKQPLLPSPIHSLHLAQSVLDDLLEPLLLRFEAADAQEQSWAHEWLSARNQLKAATQHFNAAIAQYNQAIAQLPTLIIAQLSGTKKLPFLGQGIY